MTEIRWLATLPDPTSGRDAPVLGPGSKRFEWLAADKVSARTLAEKDLTPAQFRLASIVSVIEFETRQNEPRRVSAWPAKHYGRKR
jgi:hypothetical protein